MIFVSKNEVPEGFDFREFENGPRRDVAREFYELMTRFGWMHEGPEWDDFMVELRRAREAGLQVADTMLRSEVP